MFCVFCNTKTHTTICQVCHEGMGVVGLRSLESELDVHQIVSEDTEADDGIDQMSEIEG